MSGIFISYRRQDSQGSAGRLADTLRVQFAQSQIFRDIETIEPGIDFVEAIERALGSCMVLLAVIGPRWLSATDKIGRRRLDDPNDYTRIEIAAALQRKVRVIPVLVDGATMPDAEELPDDLKTLARRQASELSDKRWDFDVRQLVLTIEKIPGIQKRSDAPMVTGGDPAAPQPNAAMARGTKVALWGGIAAAVLIGTAFMLWQGAEELNPASDVSPSDVISRVAPAPTGGTGADAGSAGRRAVVPAMVEPSNQPVKKVPPSTSKREGEVIVPPIVEKVPERPKYVDISGAWVDVYGNGYSLLQQDNLVNIRMMANSLGRDAEGRGTVSGRAIAMDYAFRDPTVGYSVGRAIVEVSPDGSTIQGTYVDTASGIKLPFLLRR